MRLLFLTIVLLAVAYTECATTAHPTREPNEHESFRFAYDPKSHQLLLVYNHDCYIFTLSDSERHAVHTDAGIRSLELKVLNMIDSGVKSAVTKDSLAPSVQHMCTGHSTNYYRVM